MQQPPESSAKPDYCLTVEERGHGQRLDAYLSRMLGQCSRSQFKKLIQEGQVLLNGQSAKPRQEIRGGDRISVWLPVRSSAEELEPESMPLDILFEDEEILVVNKAPGIVVHPGAGREQGTLVHGLLAHCPRLAAQGAPQRPGIVHRLDRDTSGAMVVAKSGRAYLNLINQFKEHKVEKEYLALVHGSFAQAVGELRTDLGRHPTDRKKIAVLENKGREAVTRWQVKKQWGRLVSLLLVVIETGRTHQIRVHLSHLNHPVVGDQTYGGSRQRARSLKSKVFRDLLVGVDRQMLHAWRLAFEHPVSFVRLNFEAPLPADFAQLLETLDRLQE
ncbi:MAG: RluA family pseudouridine synthase [Desulforhabdus sp.]|nr:RluA family pseudouridine synthase [Desulforhabdus sp.]